MHHRHMHHRHLLTRAPRFEQGYYFDGPIEEEAESGSDADGAGQSRHQQALSKMSKQVTTAFPLAARHQNASVGLGLRARRPCRRLMRAVQVDALEEEIARTRDWSLMGEASSGKRPANSLLEMAVEFDRATKQAAPGPPAKRPGTICRFAARGPCGRLRSRTAQ
jgi:hypothetical protein